MINNSQGYVWKAIEKQELEDGLRLEVMVNQTVNLVKKKRERGYLSDKENSVLTELTKRRVLYICV